MREPFISEALQNGPTGTTDDGGDPAHPDRARIDSEVRALLRPASTPWIVFDRDSRCDDFAKSALRVGAVFMSSPNFRPEVLKAAEESGRSLADVVAKPLPGLAPPPPPAAPVFPVEVHSTTTDVVSVAEPSSIVVATDVSDDSRSMMNPQLQAKRDHRALFALACAAVIAVVGSAGVVTRARSIHASGSASAPATTQSDDITVEEVVPAVALAALPTEVPAPAVLSALPVPKASPEVKPDAKGKRFGKLTIRSEAKHKNVYFDGKRMLGTGSRSFLVFCGMHTIAVTDKTDAKDVEVPCDGEYVVSR